MCCRVLYKVEAAAGHVCRTTIGPPPSIARHPAAKRATSQRRRHHRVPPGHQVFHVGLPPRLLSSRIPAVVFPGVLTARSRP